MGHFNFQCSGHNDSISYLMGTSSFYCDDMITPNQHDELTLFLGCEELSRKTSLLDMSDPACCSLDEVLGQLRSGFWSWRFLELEFTRQKGRSGWGVARLPSLTVGVCPAEEKSRLAVRRLVLM